jgi:hypothetical protein
MTNMTFCAPPFGGGQTPVVGTCNPQTGQCEPILAP